VLSSGASSLRLGTQEIIVDEALRAERPGLAAYAGSKLMVGIRPEDLMIAPDHDADAVLKGDVELVESLGSEILVHFALDAARLHAEGARQSDDNGTSELTRSDMSVARLEPRTPIRQGERIGFTFKPERLHFFDAETGDAVWM
jgi:multiple sugar transport system ATP-binding protein